MTDIIAAFGLFAFVTSITPGPNNLMLLASGVNYGFRATIPHMLGISCGFLLMLLAVGFGLGEVFARHPVIYSMMKWAGTFYLLYLAWHIANAGIVDDSAARTRQRGPLSLPGAALFQWVNPKAWVMAVSAFSIYVPPASGWLIITTMSVFFAAVNLPCVSCWALFGSRLRRWLGDSRRAQLFNLAMAVLLVASLLPIWRDH
jgi:threonine/homoserine/homoserine lactone efflux protein